MIKTIWFFHIYILHTDLFTLVIGYNKILAQTLYEKRSGKVVSVLCERLGLEPKLLAKIINSSSGRCWSSESYNPCPGVVMGIPSSNNYQGGFATGLMTKVCVLMILLLCQ